MCFTKQAKILSAAILATALGPVVALNVGLSNGQSRKMAIPMTNMLHVTEAKPQRRGIGLLLATLTSVLTKELQPKVALDDGEFGAYYYPDDACITLLFPETEEEFTYFLTDDQLAELRVMALATMLPEKTKDPVAFTKFMAWADDTCKSCQKIIDGKKLELIEA